MKINQSAVNTQPKMPVRENTEKAVSSDVQSDEKTNESAVKLSVSQRNVVDVASNKEGVPEKPEGGIKALLEKLMANPESTATAHAGLSPEKVLQLLA